MNIHIKPISRVKLKKFLEVDNLIKSKDDNAIKSLYLEIIKYIEKRHPYSRILVYYLNPIVKIEDNYDKLLISKDNMSRSSTYSHYVDKKRMLRTHTSAKMPDILKNLSRAHNWNDVIIILPGLVYRRDVTDKIHLGICHQLDVWRVVKGVDTIITKENSNLKLNIGNNSIIQLSELSEIKIVKLYKKNKIEKSNLFVNLGSVNFKLKLLNCYSPEFLISDRNIKIDNI